VSNKRSKNSQPAPPPAVPDVPAADRGIGGNHSGRVKFDDRGNAVWEWSTANGSFDANVSSQRMKKLEHPALSLAEDAPSPYDIARPNPLGKVKGYNPYESGKLGKPKEAAKKTDLRRLSEWMKLKKQHKNLKEEDES
jgi:hypothetical protein